MEARGRTHAPIFDLQARFAHLRDDAARTVSFFDHDVDRGGLHRHGNGHFVHVVAQPEKAPDREDRKEHRQEKAPFQKASGEARTAVIGRSSLRCGLFVRFLIELFVRLFDGRGGFCGRGGFGSRLGRRVGLFERRVDRLFFRRFFRAFFRLVRRLLSVLGLCPVRLVVRLVRLVFGLDVRVDFRSDVLRGRNGRRFSSLRLLGVRPGVVVGSRAGRGLCSVLRHGEWFPSSRIVSGIRRIVR